MDLLEYQAKELFQQVGIPILPSQAIYDLSELKSLNIPYPVVLKSQVRAGGRGRAGGIRFVENTIDAIVAARAIFNLPIGGEYPEAILAEARYDAQEEFFLAVLLDYHLQRPVLLGSAQGGMDVDTLLQHMKKVVVEEDFSPFYARRLAIAMGLRGKSIQAVSTIVEKMYSLFLDNDLDLVEINPLGVRDGGEVMALDGKIAANDAAIGRQGTLLSLTAGKLPLGDTLALSPQEPWRSIESADRQGKVGIVTTGLGLALAIWDAIALERGQLACAWVVEECQPPTCLAQRLVAALDCLLDRPGLKGVLVNCLTSEETASAIAEAIAHFLQPPVEPRGKFNSEDRMLRATGATLPSREKGEGVEFRPSYRPASQLVPLAICLPGANLDPWQERLSALPVYWTDDLEDAISHTVTLAKS